MSSDKTRKELTALPFSEKMKILEKLRRRSLAIAPAREALARKRAEAREAEDKKSKNS